MQEEWIKKAAEEIVNGEWTCNHANQATVQVFMGIIESHYRAATPTGTSPENAWLLVEKIAFDMVYRCGHPRGGCPIHCDRLVKMVELAKQQLKARAATKAESMPPKCPKCGNVLAEIRYPSDSPLNRDQWESQLPGDLFCTCHNNHRGNKPYAYFWKHEFEARAATKAETCPSCGYENSGSAYHGLGFCRDPWHSPAPAPQKDEVIVNGRPTGFKARFSEPAPMVTPKLKEE